MLQTLTVGTPLGMWGPDQRQTAVEEYTGIVAEARFKISSESSYFKRKMIATFLYTGRD
jgi:hypothetical protein